MIDVFRQVPLARKFHVPVYAIGLAFSIVYVLAYMAAWFNSLDQWFLPAGLRVAGLLLLPYRMWPYLFLGDVSALLLLRVPRAPYDGELWSYLSPFFLTTAVSIGPLIVRRVLNDSETFVKWLPAVALLLASWGVLCNVAVNALLGGPNVIPSVEHASRLVVGFYLGTFIVLLPALLWRIRGKYASILEKKALLRDVLIAVSWVVLVCYLAGYVRDTDMGTRMGAYLLIFLPGVFMTTRHGWPGAALGVAITNLALGVALPDPQMEGGHEPIIFVVQQVMAVVMATAYLVLGFSLSETKLKEHRSRNAAADAKSLARTSFASTERLLRENLLYMAQVQLMLEGERKDLVEWLKQHGKFEAAMSLNSDGLQHRQLFDEQAMALYPIRIEEAGLFRAVHDKAFCDFWAGDAVVNFGCRGPVRELSMDIQLTAFRCICHSIALLSDYSPDEYSINMRAWCGHQTKGILLRISAIPTSSLEVSQAGQTAEMLLEARLKAHSASMRRNGPRLTILLTEMAN